MKTLPRTAICCLLVFAATACGEGTEPEVRDVQQAIAGGYEDATDKHAVAIRYEYGSVGGICSGALISPNVVLTARHCVADQSPNNSYVDCAVTTFLPPHAASDIRVTTETRMPGDVEEYLPVAQVFVPGGSDLYCGNDLALLQLEQPIPAAVATPAVPRVDLMPVVQESYSAIGHGLSEVNGVHLFTRHRRDDLALQCIGADCQHASFVPGMWRGETGMCPGDSGGGAYDLEGRVIGVASTGQDGCTVPGYTDVIGWADWLMQTTESISLSTGITPPPWTQGYPTDPRYSLPVGAACEVDEDCPSEICVEGVCSRACIDAAPCPDGYDCAADDGICQPWPEPLEPTVTATATDAGQGCSVGHTPPNAMALLMLFAALAAARRGHRRASALP